MTDRSGPVRDWRVVLAAGTAVLTAAVVTLVARSGDPATADSYLGEVRNAAVVLADGREVTAADGMQVPPGSVVRTGAGGAATVATAGRAVYLGALTTVQVLDGVRQRLERGQVMVDARGGPRLLLSTRAGAADVADGSLVRVETGPVLRLGVFAGGAASLTATGRQTRTQVQALHQVLAPYTTVPGRPTVLALRDDGWEQRLAAELVNADKDLNALARGLTGSSGAAVLQAAPAALRQTSLPGDRGEQALSVAVAQSSRREATLADTLSFVLRARGEGGSWGAVAALVEARVTAVSGLLDTLLSPPGPTGPPVLAGGPTPGFIDPLGPRPSASGGSPSPGSSPSPGPSRTGNPTTSPSTTVSPPPPADDLITTVVGLLSSSPTPAASPRATLPIRLP